MSQAKKFFSGNTLEQAVLQAARHFQLDPELVAFEQVERRHGFLKVRRRVVIGVDPDAPGRSEKPKAAASPETDKRPDGSGFDEHARGDTPAPASRRGAGVEAPVATPVAARRPEPGRPRPQAEPEPSDVEAWDDLAPADAVEAAQETLRRLFRLGDLDLEAKIETGDTGLEVELRGSDEDQLFEDRGRLLLAIQHLLPRMIRGLTGGSVACRVDSDNFHEVRAEQLRVMAQEAAADVRRDRRMQSLEPMSPDERRIVHLTLADDPAVETESHGTGLFKRVAIRPVRRTPRAPSER